MKFLCVSDQIDPLVYSTTVKERYGDVDAVFCAGDLSMDYVDFIVTALGKPTYFVFGNHNLSEFPYYNKFKSQDVRSQGVMCDYFSMNHAHGGDYAGNKVIRDKHLTFTNSKGKQSPLLICGISGSRKYNNGQCQYTEFQMQRQLFALIPHLIWNKIRYGRYCDVFLTHATPRHVHDREDPCHKGFKCFNKFVKRFAPTLMIHGHIHLYDLSEERTSVYEKTTIVNAYSHVIIDLTAEDKGGPLEFTVSVSTSR